MIYFSIVISNQDTIIGPGGLFDIDATLPLVIIQFILLSIILNVMLYSPLSVIITERKEYILTKLSQASKILAEANELRTEYQQKLNTAKKEAQLEITESQKIHTEIFASELTNSQNYIDNILESINQDLQIKKKMALSNLDNVVESLSINIENKLSI